MQNAMQPAARVRPGPSGLGTAVKVGAVTGQIAGLIMAVVVMLVFTLFLGKGPLYPVQVIGSFGLGDAALQGLHWGAILLGLVLHQLGPSLFWGVVFGLIAERRHGLAGTSPWLLGLVIGLLSQVIGSGAGPRTGCSGWRSASTRRCEGNRTHVKGGRPPGRPRGRGHQCRGTVTDSLIRTARSGAGPSTGRPTSVSGALTGTVAVAPLSRA